MAEMTNPQEHASDDFDIELTGYRLDMTNIFHYLTAQYKDEIENCPMVVAVKELPDRRPSLRLNDRKGNTKVILLREAAGPIMLSNLYEEIVTPHEAEDFPTDCAFYFDIPEVYNLYVMILSLADSLKISCPQLIFTKNMPAEGYRSLTAEADDGSVNTLFIRQMDKFSVSIAAMAKEMRKIWQHEKHENLYYSSYTEYDPQAAPAAMHAFRMQKAEIDSEAFSLRFLGHALNAVVRAGSDDAEANDAVNARADKMAVPF